MAPSKTAAIVMLYGISQGDAVDENYIRYFGGVLDRLKERDSEAPPLIYLGGGATDPSRPHLTEAGTAQDIFMRMGVSRARLRVHPHGLDARDALKFLSLEVSRNVKTVKVFCASTHQDLVWFLARKAFAEKRVEIVPLPFPAGQNSAKALLVRIARLPRVALGVAAWHSPRARQIERWLRRRHMRRAAAFPEHLR